MYNSKRWQDMRAIHLAQEPWCRECLKLNVYEFATEVDHITPHKGDPVLFFDRKNLQSLCNSHHSSKTAEEVWHTHE
jgi:5-methylcytosine-specific restriction protein A